MISINKNGILDSNVYLKSLSVPGTATDDDTGVPIVDNSTALRLTTHSV